MSNKTQEQENRKTQNQVEILGMETAVKVNTLDCVIVEGTRDEQTHELEDDIEKLWRMQH